MSLILEALRKSERTRQQSLTGQVSAADTPPMRARMPVPWATLIGLLLIANVVVLGIIFWRSHAIHPASVSMATVTAPESAVAAPAAPVYRPAVRSLAVEAAAAGITSVATPAAITAVPSRAAVTTSAPIVTTANPAAATTVTAIPPASGVIYLNAGNAPPLDTLPRAFQLSLPALNLDVHSYSANPAERFVVINMQRYQKGDTLKEGPKVIQIVPNGVVLEYHGQEFLLPRP